VEAKALLSNQEQPVTIDIDGISIVNDYDRKVFPAIRLVTKLDIVDYYNIQQDNDVKFSVTIKKFNQTNLEKNDISLFSYIIKDKIFVPMDRDKTPVNNEDGLTAKQDSMPGLHGIYTLISEEDLNNNKRMVNTVLSNTDMEGAILYLANRFSSKPVIFEKPDNQKLYNQIIIPPNNIIRSMKYLDTVYGIYNNGLRIFFDLDTYYIINKLDNTNVKTIADDPQSVYVTVYSDNDSLSQSLYYDDAPAKGEGIDFYTAKVHIADTRFINYEDSKKEFVGTNNIILSQNINELRTSNYGETDSLKTRVYYNRYNNLFKEKEVLTGGIKGFFMVCTLDNLDINTIKCNHRYYIEFSNNNYKNYDGEYQIMKAEHRFIVGDNGYSALQSKIYFMKK